MGVGQGTGSGEGLALVNAAKSETWGLYLATEGPSSKRSPTPYKESDMEHTSGPHRIDKEILNYQGYINPEFSDRYAGCIKSEGNMVLAVVIDDDTPGEANLRLYAAAPKLLEACKATDAYLLAAYPQNMKLKMIANALVEQAIAEATGE